LKKLDAAAGKYAGSQRRNAVIEDLNATQR
jgi:hypothetical protein